jgi:cysteine desulfurase
MPIFPRKTYLDHNATTPLVPEVRRAMAACLKKVHGNASSLHTVGRKARGMLDQARASVAALLGCEDDQVFFTSGGTEANNAVIKGVFHAAKGGHIVTSKIEHDSTLGACCQVECLGGEVTYLDAGPDGRISPEDVRKAIRPDTILVSIMHANNETGAIQPIAEISAIAAAAGVPMHTDAVQTFGKISTTVDELGVEFLSLSAHKINGPKGVGALYWRGNTNWMPLLYGGHQERKLRTGTEAVHQIVGLGVAAELSAKRMESEHERLGKLRELLVAGLRRAYPDVRINECPATHQLPGTVSATFPGKSGIHILAGLDCYEVCVSIGSACTADQIEPSHVLLGMGRSEEDALSTIRISMGTTTTAGDVKYLPKALVDVLQNEPPGFGWIDPHHLTEEKIRSSKTFIIDIRYPYERMLSPSVPGANLWSYIGFGRYIKRVPKDKDVIIMCGTGIMSFSSGYRLAKSGHPSVHVVYGGYAAWRALYPDVGRKQ